MGQYHNFMFNKMSTWRWRACVPRPVHYKVQTTTQVYLCDPARQYLSFTPQNRLYSHRGIAVLRRKKNAVIWLSLIDLVN